MDHITKDDLRLDVSEPSPADLQIIETALSEWAQSDIPETQQFARQYRALIRTNDKALEMLEARP